MQTHPDPRRDRLCHRHGRRDGARAVPVVRVLRTAGDAARWRFWGALPGGVLVLAALLAAAAP